jgi:hypothetical protein
LRTAFAAILASLLSSACSTSSASRADASAPADSASCTALFGVPNQSTGLGADQCRPQCGCGADAYAPPAYDAAFVQSLIDDWQLTTPYAPLTSNPYDQPAPAADPPDTVCGVLEQAGDGGVPRPYTLVTYPSPASAAAAGAKVTHFGHCGVCSTLANLAVYIRQNDLVAPVRACGLQASLAADDSGEIACLEQLGFDLPCAQIWAYNTDNTRSVCLQPCLADLSAPYNEPDGALNACLQCDEDQSGPVFKAVAGRDRRNSGIPNAICRPCGEVQPLVQSY